MPQKQGNIAEQALREMEEAAYHAYREWAVFLMLRCKQLQAHQFDAKKQDAAPDQISVLDATRTTGTKGRKS